MYDFFAPGQRGYRRPSVLLTLPREENHHAERDEYTLNRGSPSSALCRDDVHQQRMFVPAVSAKNEPNILNTQSSVHPAFRPNRGAYERPAEKEKYGIRMDRAVAPAAMQFSASGS